jgi:hypothetical protein
MAKHTSVLSLLHSPVVVSWKRIRKSLAVTSSHTRSLLCRAQFLSCHYSQPSSTAESLNSLLQLPTSKLDSILILVASHHHYITSGRTHRKHRFLYCCVLIHFCRNVFTVQLRSNESSADPQRTSFASQFVLLRDVTA